MTDLAAVSGRASRRREERRRAKITGGARRSDAPIVAASTSISAGRPDIRVPAWVTAEFPNATILGLGIAAIALAMAFDALLSPGFVLASTVDERISFGRWILSHAAVPRVDHWSWLMEGKDWQDNEWFSDVLFALAYPVAGWAGECVLTAVAMAATGLIIGLSVGRRLGGLPFLLTVGLGAFMLVDFSMARGQTLALPFIAAWVDALLTARDEKRSPSFWLLIVMLILVQLHGLFLFALLLVCPFAMEATIEAPAGQRFAVARAWTLFGLAAIGVAMVNPYGFEAFTFPFHLMSKKTLLTSPEWGPLNFTSPKNKLDVFIVALIGCALLLPLRMNAIRVALVVAFFGMSSQHLRSVMLFTLITPMLLAGPIAKALDQRRALDWRRAARIATLSVGIVAVVFGAERLAWPIERQFGPGANSTPAPVYAELREALDAVPPALHSHRVYNDSFFGSYLIGVGVRDFIDDRVELFGDEPTAFPYSFLDEKGVDWTVETPNLPAERAHDADPKWVRLYRGAYVSVHARKSALEAIKSGGS